ncbi:urease accessory protein UreE [Sphingobacterium sp. SGR-19]|uniref:urease accessory protein UreE n=1 Tax=Sphingobacterium sp. SGR-19 TaxID=2710886 RepID=UPI0013EB24BA|nr:urease accessory protein UreE [Sphingobacterium sp. SGR-19]NGM63990.1 urease accessory protein UreE [Sphingobacterium sp. SGR-19]
MYASGPKIDFLPLQWYEVNRTVIKRKTEGGRDVSLSRFPKTPIYNGEVLYETDEVIVKARVEPCACIVLHANDMATIGNFCFDVGNRHLPIFCIDDRMVVSYDGRLFQALSAKYGDKVRMEAKRLDVRDAIKAFGNYL